LKINIVIFLLFFLKMAYSQVQVVCYGTTTTYNVDTNEGGVSTPNGTVGSTYSWRVIEANSATITGNGTNSISINWGTTVAGPYTVEVVETNASCSAPAVTLSVAVKNNPTVIAPNTAVCLGSPTTITATASPAAMSDVYSWTTPVSYVGSTNTVTITNATLAMAGNYVVTVTDVDGCVSTPATAVLTVNSLPDATVTAGSSTTFCAGGNVILTAPSTSGLTYQWNKDGTTILNQTSQVYTVNQAGVYTLTTTDLNSCSNTTNLGISVTVNPLPVITLSAGGPVEFCDGLNVILTPSITVGSAPFSYQWINLSGNIALATASTYTATTTSSYQVKVVDANTCESISSSIDVTVRSNPDASITALSSTTFCAGDNVVLKRGVSSVSGLTYQWIKDGANISSGGGNFEYIATESGTYKVQVVDTNFSTNCTTITSSPIVVTKTNLPVTSSINY
jgi:hypothetical protein